MLASRDLDSLVAAYKIDEADEFQLVILAPFFLVVLIAVHHGREVACMPTHSTMTILRVVNELRLVEIAQLDGHALQKYHFIGAASYQCFLVEEVHLPQFSLCYLLDSEL